MADQTKKELLMTEELIGFEKLADKQAMRRASSAKVLKPADHRKPRSRE